MYKRWALLVAVVTVIALAAGGLGLVTMCGEASFADVSWYAFGLVLSLPSLGLGLAIAAREPANPTGVLLALVGLAVAFIPSLETYTAAARLRPAALPLPDVVAPLSQGLWMLWYVPVALLVLFFPDGRLPGPRWRWVAGGLVADVVLFVPLAGMNPAAYPAPGRDAPHALGTLPGWAAPLVAALPLVLMALLAASAAAMVLKYRRADDPVRRARLKWLAVAGLWLPVTLLLCWAGYLFAGKPDLALAGLFGLFVTLPVGTSIALLRHDLYDIDKAISTAVTYGLVTAALLGVYTAVVAVGGLLAGRGGSAAAAAATAVCAAVLTPVRVRLQRAVDRRMYPRRRAVLEAVEELRRRTHAGEAEPEQLESVLRDALRDPGLRVAYRLPGTNALVDARGHSLTPPGGQITPITLSGQEIGALLRGEVGSPQLLREIAAAAALLVEVVRLRIELAEALREVESSRGRLLAAGYRERRRLERDLHDGAQQRLVALGMSLRLAQRHLGDGSVDLDGLLDQSVAELGTAVAELRAIAHGLRPSSLDDGLDVAVRTLAGSLPCPVSLEIDAGVVADDVATTAYYVVSEAVTNAVKHAGACGIQLRIIREDDLLTIQISDDGRGGAGMRRGSGLSGLSDRVAAAGGSLHLNSPAGRGTTIRAVLPCAS
ncbi:sensor histidine kinase [Sphaerisporangium fuscum]|uniref:sensor histidine kinase n=1 Tax=Sphaerisporangium fuscum TaxID=2835868 RepID=UPI001BDC2DF3|nr:histidine kinase [Sphaerisporangium fuscum]